LDNLELVVAYQSALPERPEREELHAFWAAHITGLLRQVRPDLDAETTTAADGAAGQ
jgi:hypothetical protein